VGKVKGRYHKVRKPVRRLGAEEYLRLMLYSFAGGVVVTRLWLELVNYPVIGGGGIHIAHVLLGGLLLFWGAMFPLMFSNRWVYSVGAVLTGFGTGLFIDELGKFITANNDYFYPPAMPIIYALFLMLVSFYLRFRNGRSTDERHKLYESLEAMQEVLDFDLDKDECKRLKRKLIEVGHSADNAEYRDLANSLLRFLKMSSVEIAPESFSFFERIFGSLRIWVEKVVRRKLFKMFLIVVLGATGFISFFDLVAAMRATVSYEYLVKLTSDVFIYGDLIGTQARVWFLVRLFMEGVVGVVLLYSVRFFVVGKDRKAVEIGQWGLILSLAGVNLLLFYFDQIRAVASVLWDYFLLILILRYKEVYLFKSYKKKITS